jgi:hypothetical protein
MTRHSACSCVLPNSTARDPSGWNTGTAKFGCRRQDRLSTGTRHQRWSPSASACTLRTAYPVPPADAAARNSRHAQFRSSHAVREHRRYCQCPDTQASTPTRGIARPAHYRTRTARRPRSASPRRRSASPARAELPGQSGHSPPCPAPIPSSPEQRRPERKSAARLPEPPTSRSAKGSDFARFLEVCSRRLVGMSVLENRRFLRGICSESAARRRFVEM